MEELKCDICGKTGFKSKAGLVGHKKIVHGAETRKTIPDEMGKRLEGLEVQIYGLASGIDTLAGALIKKFTGKEEEITVYRNLVEDFGSKVGKKLAEYKRKKNAE